MPKQHTANGVDHGAWKPSITIKQILLGVQDLLNNPYPAGARREVEAIYRSDRKAYDKRLKEEVCAALSFSSSWGLAGGGVWRAP